MGGLPELRVIGYLSAIPENNYVSIPANLGFYIQIFFTTYPRWCRIGAV
jgi:hypothetical protein